MKNNQLFKIIVITGIILFLTVILKEPVTKAVMLNYPLINAKIYLDAGHGGYDPGATTKEYREKDINLAIVLKLKDSLEHYGATVYLIRDEDEEFSDKSAPNKKRSDLNYRVRTINNSDCDIYLTIHLNSIPNPRWRGAQVFYYPKYDNERLAYLIQESLKANLNNTTRIPKIKKDSFVLENTTKVGALIEAGFMTNPDELKLLVTPEYQGKVVEAITSAVIDYFLPVK